MKSREIKSEFVDKIAVISSNETLLGPIKITNARESFRDTLFTFHLSNEADYSLCVKEFIAAFEWLANFGGAVFKAAYSRLYPAVQYEDAKKEMYSFLESRFYSDKSECYSNENHERRESVDNTAFINKLSVLPRFITYDDAPVYSQFIDNWLAPQKIHTLCYKDIRYQYDAIIRKIIGDSKMDENIEVPNFREFNSINEVITEIRRILDAVIDFHLQGNQNDNSVIGYAIHFIEKNYQNDITLATVSNYYNLNYSYFSRIFKKNTGISFSQYLLNIRMGKARELIIKHSDIKIGDVAKKVGYNEENLQNFTRAFKKHFGKSPKSYKSDPPIKDGP